MTDKLYYKYFEISLALHCNLKCKECSHLSPFAPNEFYEFETFKKDIDILNSVYHVKELRFMGGEPLLNKNLVNYIEYTKKIKFAETIGVCTNGILLKHQGNLFFEKVDFIDVSYYPSVGYSHDKLEKLLEDKKVTFGTDYRIKEVGQFTKRNVTIPNKPENIEDIYKNCAIPHVWHNHTIYNGYYYKCSRPFNTNFYLDKITFGDNTDFVKLDGVKLDQPNIKNKIQDYISSPYPLHSCKWCIGARIHKFRNKYSTLLDTQQMTNIDNITKRENNKCRVGKGDLHP